MKRRFWIALVLTATVVLAVALTVMLLLKRDPSVGGELSIEYSDLYEGYAVMGLGTLSGTEVTIPSAYNGEPVIAIGDNAFKNCADITSLTVPDSVTEIGYRPFDGCSSLTSINLPYALTRIDGLFDDTAWYKNQPDGAAYLGAVLYKYKGTMPENTAITVKEGTKSIADFAFEDCAGLTSVQMPSSVRIIGDGAFAGCTGLTSATIPFGAENLGGGAFDRCTELSAVSVPDSVTRMGDGVFNRTAWYDNQPQGVIYADKFAYGYKYPLKPEDASLAIADGTKGIADYAFRGIAELTSLTIPGSVAVIGAAAFANCDALTSVTISDGVESIEASAFSACAKLTSLDIPDSVTNISCQAFEGCIGVTAITVGGGNSAYKSVDGNLYSKSGETLVQYAAGKPDTSFIIPEGVTGIGKFAVNSCKNLISVTVPEGVTRIGSDAFYNCGNLASVNLPDSLTNMGNTVFTWCYNITAITVGGGNPVYKTIDGNLYSKDGKTLLQYAIGKENRDFSIPEGVTTIGKNAFKNAYKLTSVTIPSSVTSIGDSAFGGVGGLWELKTVTVDSAAVAASMTDRQSVGGLIYYAETIYLKADIASVGSYITDNYTISSASGKAGYVRYAKMGGSPGWG